MASDVQQTPFVKQLAANDRVTRDAALESLRSYLSGSRTFALLDLLKIWKGLFYCMWMCDRPRPQQALATDLAALINDLPKRNVIPFLRAFWQTMAREWTNIDVLRMEKFLLLTRRVVGTTFAYLQSKGWDEELVKEHLALLEEIPLNGPDHKLPNGMRYHVIDIYIDELQKIGAVDGDDKEAEDKEAPLPTLLEPLKKLEKESPTKAVRVKCKEALADERLPKSVKPEEEEGSDDGEWGGIDG